ncbi:MAG TPA: hypothetical protein VM910_35795, partial [Bradyrhizobium sp.]|nr:hypothetical protein [Bradyrhizobium sp.]
MPAPLEMPISLFRLGERECPVGAPLVLPGIDDDPGDAFDPDEVILDGFDARDIFGDDAERSRSLSSKTTPLRSTTPSFTVIERPSRGTQTTFASLASPDRWRKRKVSRRQ